MNLNYNKHLENCLKLISHKAYLLGKIRMYIDTKTAVTIDKTMILPVLEYGDVIYDGANQKLLNDLQTMQNRIVQICVQKMGVHEDALCWGFTIAEIAFQKRGGGGTIVSFSNQQFLA